MNFDHFDFASMLLVNGQVLAVGGNMTGVLLRHAELFEVAVPPVG